jgi:hypothetical protein
MKMEEWLFFETSRGHHINKEWGFELCQLHKLHTGEVVDDWHLEIYRKKKAKR